VSLGADLSSMQSSLDQLVDRLQEVIDQVRGTDRDDLLGDLYEIERHLRSAHRRLGRACAAVPEAEQA
jgi:hypothetical protein